MLNKPHGPGGRSLQMKYAPRKALRAPLAPRFGHPPRRPAIRRSGAFASGAGRYSLRHMTPRGKRMLEANDLHKAYGAVAAVRGVSLAVAPGEILGLLGPNGAGKSTTVSMLCGLVRADRGDVFVGAGASRLALDQDAHAAKRRIGVVPQELSIYENLGAAANLELF